MTACVHSILACGECRQKVPMNPEPTPEQLDEYQRLKAKQALHAQGMDWQEYASLKAVYGTVPAKGTWQSANSSGVLAPTNGHATPTLAPATQPPLRLDLGCGKNKREGFTGVDVRQFPGVDVVADLAKPWPWPDGSVEEVHCSHMLEHVKREDRPFFFNELYRVLKPGGKATFITPHWASCRAYGDVTHEWPPVSEFFWLYLDKAWREVNAPHNDQYTCDFATTYGYSPAAWLVGRNPEYVQEALTKFKEAAQDMQSTCVKR